MNLSKLAKIEVQIGLSFSKPIPIQNIAKLLLR